MAEKAVIMERKYPNTETNTAVTPGTTCTKIKLVRTHAPRSANGLIHFGFFARPPVHSTGYINRGNHGSVLHCRENLSRVSLVRDQQSVTGLATLLTPTGRATLSGLVALITKLQPTAGIGSTTFPFFRLGGGENLVDCPSRVAQLRRRAP